MVISTLALGLVFFSYLFVLIAAVCTLVWVDKPHKNEGNPMFESWHSCKRKKYTNGACLLIMLAIVLCPILLIASWIPNFIEWCKKV